MGRSRIVLADDHRGVRETVSDLLAPRFDVVGTAGGGLDALRLVTALCPDAIVLDLAMPDLDGLEVAARIRKTGFPTAIVMLTVSADSVLAEAALAAGALGYVTKTRAGTDLIPALDAALAGQRFVSPPLGRPP